MALLRCFTATKFFDGVNSRDKTKTDPLHLRRFDYSIAGGGPIWKDRIFFFGSSERIMQDRGVDFLPDLPAHAGNARLLSLLHNQEDALDGFDAGVKRGISQAQRELRAPPTGSGDKLHKWVRSRRGRRDCLIA